MKAAGSPSARRAALIVFAAVFLAGLSACYRDVSDPESTYLPYTRTVPLTIRGVLPGQPGDDVVALLGPPDRRNAAGYQVETLPWQRFGDLFVTVDTRSRRVTEVLGNRLDADGKAVVSSGMSEADVRAVLGKPAASKRHYRSSGSGVISLGMKRVGATLTYRRDGNDAEVTLNEDRVAYIRLRRTAP